jgi:tRNA/tmRNA/rRNA uracil-C5-methylase (TrmA/RlmC/RlmD family)
MATALGRYRPLGDGRVVLVAFAAPGELVAATVDRPHADYVEAHVTRVLEPSPDRVEPPCPVFGQCGGCQLQHLAYPAQLAAKEAVVREQLRRIGHLDDAVVRPIRGAANPWEYRNHVRFSTGKMYGDVGFMARGGRPLLKIDHCPIADPWVNELLPKLQGRGSGLHQIQVRRSATTGSFLVYPTIPGMEAGTGQGVPEELGGKKFQVSASASQVNHPQAEQMAELVGEAPESGDLSSMPSPASDVCRIADRPPRPRDRVACGRERTHRTSSRRRCAGEGGKGGRPPAAEGAPDAICWTRPAPAATPLLEAIVLAIRGGMSRAIPPHSRGTCACSSTAGTRSTM